MCYIPSFFFCCRGVWPLSADFHRKLYLGRRRLVFNERAEQHYAVNVVEIILL